jgi:glutathione-independent formaldehyde dehydrogenase
MKALTYKGSHKVAVEETKDPKIEQPTDAILKVTSTAICGSDLHMYDGRTEVETGKIFGHEIMGVISEVGPGVTQLKVGDRVVLPFNIGCGTCYNCVRGWTSACLTLNPEAAGAAYGYAGMGPYAGGQAEFVRVPFADFNALKLPGEPGDELEDDFLMLADIFPTAWHATELANVQMGGSVAIYGAGPVGLLSILSARLKGAAEIFCVDYVDTRLEKAREMGAIPIKFDKNDPKPSEQIIALRKKNTLLADALRPGEEKRLEGVDSGIDAIGYQARDFKDPSHEEANEALEDLIQLVLPTGSIGVIGVYMEADPNAATDDLKQGRFKLSFGSAWTKGISIGTGQCPVKKYNEFLRDLIIAGKARPGTIISHDVGLDEAPKWYERFDKREEGITKVVLHPAGAAK